jgi:hypothetical protein
MAGWPDGWTAACLDGWMARWLNSEWLDGAMLCQVQQVPYQFSLVHPV